MTTWFPRKKRRNRVKRYLFEENAFQKYLVNRTKTRDVTNSLENIKCQEKQFIDQHSVKDDNTVKYPKSNIIEMECDDEIDLSLYKNFGKYPYH